MIKNNHSRLSSTLELEHKNRFPVSRPLVRRERWMIIQPVKGMLGWHRPHILAENSSPTGEQTSVKSLSKSSYQYALNLTDTGTTITKAWILSNKLNACFHDFADFFQFAVKQRWNTSQNIRGRKRHRQTTNLLKKVTPERKAYRKMMRHHKLLRGI